MNEILQMILKEVDEDIKEAFNKYITEGYNKGYKQWELLQDAPLVALKWQELRDRKKV